MMGRHFSVNPWNSNSNGGLDGQQDSSSSSNFNLRTFKDGTKAIEVVEVDQALEEGLHAR